MYAQRRRRRFSPLMLLGIFVPLVLVIIGGSVFAWNYENSHAAADTSNPNCTLRVPANPLSANGLATPYQLFAPDADANGPCNEANTNQSAFVQGVIYNPATGAFSVYNPLVIDAGTQPAVVPTAPTLPANAVVGLWFGFNGTNLTLKSAHGNTLNQSQCVNGLNGSVFGEFAYCNAVAFFAAANQGISAGLVKVPALTTAKDGMPCMTTRDFGLIDQDQSDNVQTQYIANGNGQTAQFSAANQAAIANGTTIANPSDNALLTSFIDPALGCTSWTAPDLANNNTPVAALALDEIMANADQAAPVALVPLNDPMTLVNGNASLRKTNLYRAGTDQIAAANDAAASGTTYCQNFFTTGLARLKLDMPLTIVATSPLPASANSLFTFLAMRYNQSYTNLNCQNLINQANPVTLQLDGNGIVIGATFAGATTGTGTGTTGAGGVQQVATGNATIALNPQGGNANVTLALTYPNHPNQKIDVNLVPNSCTGTADFTQAEDTDGNSAVNENAMINGLQGLTTLPANWFFTVTDPTQTGTPVVGCGSITVNGANGSAVLGTVSTATGGTVMATPTPPASAGQVTNKMYGTDRRHSKW
jgi:hypothetical protein